MNWKGWQASKVNVA